MPSWISKKLLFEICCCFHSFVFCYYLLFFFVGQENVASLQRCPASVQSFFRQWLPCLSSLSYMQATMLSFPTKKWVYTDRQIDLGNYLSRCICKETTPVFNTALKLKIDLISYWKFRSAKTNIQKILNLTNNINDFISRSTQPDVLFNASFLKFFRGFTIKHLH